MLYWFIRCHLEDIFQRSILYVIFFSFLAKCVKWNSLFSCLLHLFFLLQFSYLSFHSQSTWGCWRWKYIFLKKKEVTCFVHDFWHNFMHFLLILHSPIGDSLWYKCFFSVQLPCIFFIFHVLNMMFLKLTREEAFTSIWITSFFSLRW